MTTEELSYLHLLKVFYPVDNDKLTEEYKQRATASLMFLAEKRDETIKARAFADGRKQ